VYPTCRFYIDYELLKIIASTESQIVDLISKNRENKINLKEFTTDAKEGRQFLFLSEVLEIIGLTVFLVYCILRIFFDLKLVGEPFNLLIIGCGLISTPHILRIFTKNFKIRSKENKAVNAEIGIIQKEV
jgi:hypothetical protein